MQQRQSAAELVPGAIGLSSSSVSRGFVEASAAKLREMQERDLSGEDVVAMVLDGKTFADATMVVALGITLSGDKRFLGFVEVELTVCDKFIAAFASRSFVRPHAVHRNSRSPQRQALLDGTAPAARPLKTRTNDRQQLRGCHRARL